MKFIIYGWMLVSLCISGLTYAETENEPGDTWLYSGGDLGGKKYSPLQQIDRDNVEQVKLAWQARTGEHRLLHKEQYENTNMQSTPILLPEAAGHHLIVCSPMNYLVALDPATGAERWRFDPQVTREAYPLFIRCRGNAFYWVDQQQSSDKPCHHRLFLSTMDRRIIALDAKTGTACEGFADKGTLYIDPKNAESPESNKIIWNYSQSVVANNTLIIGSTIEDWAFQEKPKGTIKAYDAHTGKEKWTFEIIPTDPNDPAIATWPQDGKARKGAANAWAPLSVDEENDLVFVPTSSPSPDWYGAFRKGDNLYANSLVALRASTGERAWHVQLVHHDLWDYDLPAQPVLFDYEVQGKTVPAVLQVTKMGMIYLFNRLTGEPLIPIEERAVPKSNVPGEFTAPTQPFSSIPAFVRQHIDEDDVWGFTPLDRWLCESDFETLHHAGPFTPPGFEQASLLAPSNVGGSNWSGAVITPDNLVIMNMLDLAVTFKISKDATDRQTGIYGTGLSLFTQPWLSFIGAPCVAPPWNKLIAFDLRTLTTKWEVPLGSIHKLSPIPLPFEINGYGSPGLGSGLATAGGLLFIGATSDSTLRAFDLENGEIRWKHDLPTDAHSGVSSYFYKGRQYIVTTAGVHNQFGRGGGGDYVLAFALESK